MKFLIPLLVAISFLSLPSYAGERPDPYPCRQALVAFGYFGEVLGFTLPQNRPPQKRSLKKTVRVDTNLIQSQSDWLDVLQIQKSNYGRSLTPAQLRELQRPSLRVQQSTEVTGMGGIGAWFGNKLVGYLLIARSRYHGEILDVGIHPNFQQKGILKQLFKSDAFWSYVGHVFNFDQSSIYVGDIRYITTMIPLNHGPLLEFFKSKDFDTRGLTPDHFHDGEKDAVNFYWRYHPEADPRLSNTHINIMDE